MTKYDLTSDAFLARPYDTFARMREEDPVIRQPNRLDGTTDHWYVTRFDDCEAMLKRPDLVRELLDGEEPTPPQFAELANMIRHHMLNKDGEDHRRLRGLVSQAFTPKRITQLQPRIEQVATSLLDGLYPRGEMDVVNDYGFHIPATVIMELLGIPVEDRQAFKEWSDTANSPVLGESGAEKFAAHMSGFFEYLRELFAERRAEPKGDLITALIQAEEAGDRLTERELFGTLFLLVTAGFETTMSLIGNAILAMLRNPRALADLRADPSLMPNAIEEFLRYDGPVVQSLERHATHDFELHGRKICRGEVAMLMFASANHDPRKFDRPEELDIRRCPNPHLGFGKGVHHCLGAPLARLEVTIALNALLQRLPNLRLTIAEEDLRWRNLPQIRSLVRLPVAWDVE